MPMPPSSPVSLQAPPVIPHKAPPVSTASEAAQVPISGKAPAFPTAASSSEDVGLSSQIPKPSGPALQQEFLPMELPKVRP